MPEFVLHPMTRQDIDRFVAFPSHGLAIYGPDGTGKSYVAEHVAALVLGVNAKQLASWAYYRLWGPDEKGTISVDTAHEIVNYMKLKTTGSQTIRRVVIIEHADALTTEAQNALLKMIEEPPLDTVLILTARSPESLLATIRSRVQSLHVRPPEKQALFAASTGSESDKERCYLLSDGLPGLYFALLDAQSDHPLVQSIQTAKELLAADTFTRLTKIDSLANRAETERLVYAFGQIARSGIAANATRQSQSGMAKWHSILTAVHTAEKQLSMSGSPKLVLADLFLHL